MFTTVKDLFIPTLWPGTPVLKLSSYQAKTILRERGLYATVHAIVYAPETPDRVRVAWEEGIDWRIDNEMVQGIATSAGLTMEQLTELFIAGAAIVPGEL